MAQPVWTLTRAAEGGGMSGNNGDTHVHVHQHINMQAIDTDGVRGILEKHADVVEQHVGNVLRKRNF